MRLRGLFLLPFLLCSGVVVFAAASSPAMAGCARGDRCWWHAHHAIYHMENHIAYLEANPDVDDSYKGPKITHLHYKVLHIRTKVGPRWPVWPIPCCYSRRPLYIR